MNTYHKFLPNVFLAKCTEEHEKGEVITLETKYGQEHECIVFNLMSKKEGFFYYSIVRNDGFNHQEWAKRKAERLQNAQNNAIKRSNQYFHASNKDSAFLSLGEPIKVGHHSEKRHRKIIEQARNNMDKMCAEMDKAESYESRIAYWEQKSHNINLSMPESVEYYETMLEKAVRYHEGLKNGTIKKEHSFSLTYAKKEVNDLTVKLNWAKKLWL